MTPFILVLGEIVPKTVYRYHAEEITPYLVYPLKALSILFYPLVMALTWLTTLFMMFFGGGSAQLRPHATREDLENYLVMWNIDSSLRTAEKKIVERIFDFSDKRPLGFGQTTCRISSTQPLAQGKSIFV